MNFRSLIAFFIYSACVIGDRLNEGAKRRWLEQSTLPHRIIARQWIAAKLNPWVYRDQVITYYNMGATGQLIEPCGGKEFLIWLLREHPSDYDLQALFWTGLGDPEMAKRAREKQNQAKQ